MSAGLYIHVPFCARACPYCDFDFEVGRTPDVDGFLAALDREWSERALPTGTFSTAYIGGGTPSSLGIEGLERLLGWMRERQGSLLEEWTVELNPEHASVPMFAMLRRGGVNRVSMGLQTLDPAGLHTLGRVHAATGAVRAIEDALHHGLRVSVDLIVGWPGQSTVQLQRDLDALDRLRVRHVSIYALTIEPSTPWEDLVRRGRRAMPDEDAQAELLQHAEAVLAQRGWDHYEVASYALGGERAQHNLGYWCWEDYVGLGPSAASATFAAGRVVRRANPRGFRVWSQGAALAGLEVLEGEYAAAEGLWTGLRCLGGVDCGPDSLFLQRFPQVGPEWIAARTAREVARGNLEWRDEGRRLRVAPSRWLWHDEIGAAVLDGLAPVSSLAL